MIRGGGFEGLLFEVGHRERSCKRRSGALFLDPFDYWSICSRFKFVFEYESNTGLVTGGGGGGRLVSFVLTLLVIDTPHR